MTIYVPEQLVWYILGFISPFVLIILWAVAGKIAEKTKGKPEQ